jgi:dipeptidyl aminopeptidase/acylaminoacyl peptidase
MTDLRKRFRALDDLAFPFAEPPERRISHPLELGPSPVRRAGIAILALAVAAAGFAFAVRAFGSSDPRDRDLVGVPDQPQRLAYSAPYNGQWSIFLVGADGTGAERIPADLPGDAFHPAWAPDGQRLAFEVTTNVPSDGGVETAIYVMRADGSDLTRLTDAAGWNYQPAWSPDGMQIAYVHTDGEGGNDDIWVMDANGSNPVRLTVDQAFDLNPTWSPDGSRIAFQSNRDGNNEIYAMNSDGTGETRLTDDPGFDGHPTWSPDGSTIAFAGERPEPGIYTMANDGQDVRELTSERQVGPLDPTWSPDGTSIAYTTSPQGLDASIVIVDVATGEVHAVTGIGDFASPSWQPSPAAPQPTPTEDALPQSPDAGIVATIDLGKDYAGSLAYGEGSIWVAVIGANYGGKVLRIDPATNEVIAEIATDVVPSWEVGGGGITVANGSVWLTGPIKTTEDRDGSGGYLREAGLVQIDAATNQVLSTIRLGGDSGADVVVTDEGVWTLLFSKSGMEMVQVDPATGDIVRRVELDADYGHFLFRVGSYVVAAVNVTGDAGIGETQIVAIDPTDGAILGSNVLDDYAWPASDGSELWLVLSHALEQIDPVTGDVLAGPYGIAATGDALAVADGRVWFLDPASNRDLEAFLISSEAVDVHVDVPKSATPIAIALSPGSAWVLTYEGQLLRVDLT